MWELKLYFHPSAGGLKKKEKEKTLEVSVIAPVSRSVLLLFDSDYEVFEKSFSFLFLQFLFSRSWCGSDYLTCSF